MRLIVAIFILLPFCASGQSFDSLKGLSSDLSKGLTDAVGGSLSELLQGQLGIDANQAEGGIGSMLSLASEKLSAGDFDKIASFIPGASKYMDTAKNLGAVVGPLKDVAGLNSALGSLGIPPQVISQFVPSLSKYVEQLGGAEASALLEKVLGS